MTRISIQAQVSPHTHFVVITDKFVNQFGLPEKVENYFQARLAEEKEKKKKGHITIHYNYIGTAICIMVPDHGTDTSRLQEDLRRTGSAVCDQVNALKGHQVQVVNQSKLATASLFVTEGVVLGNYQFIRHRSGAKDQANTLKNVQIIDKHISKSAVEELQSVCEATLLARDLVNEPVNILNAEKLAQSFKKMGKEAGFKVQVYNKKEIQKMKMGGLLAVNAGSVDEPTFTVMEYKAAGAKNKKPIVLVGKGVVYDTGGLSLKPTPNSMDMMKCDMAGAAAVGAAMYAIARAGLKVHVVGLVPATDNRPGYNAFAPGDIITMMDGSTVEMLNSDAEGRMILADALHYAKQYKPELVVDIATLTGAAAAAIGANGIVGMGNVDEQTRKKLHDCSFRVFERIAEFPFWDDYDDMMKSDIADQKNLGGPYAGAITAGRFLKKFTDYPYYHLDIAGPAFLTAKDGYRPKGGTGVGVRLFFDFMKHLNEKK